MFYKVKKAESTPSMRNDGNSNILITMVGQYEDNGKFIKRIKLTDFLEVLSNDHAIRVMNNLLF